MKPILKNIDSSTEKFWNSVKIYFNHPNSINKQILRAELKYILRTESMNDDSFDKICSDLLKENSFKFYHDKYNVNTSLDEVLLSKVGKYIFVQKLVPKSSAYAEFTFYQFCYFDIEEGITMFSTHFQGSVNEPNLDPLPLLKYRNLKLKYNESNSTLVLSSNDNVSEKGIKWINAAFLYKFCRLMSCPQSVIKNQLQKFTNLVDAVDYYKLYENMKLKYSKILIERWCESTDPKKFVFEDIGIATYLMLLWNGGPADIQNAKKQKFVDLGCGNGLLVYILNSEGHQGIGLDVRRRRIWETYPPFTKLKEEVVIPSEMSIYPEADWLIGNHSDELTAWLPIMASRSNIHCQYFVLPCCPFHLNGTSYQRKNSSLSVYQDFIKYVEGISKMCGFQTFVDKLRIPSTKRICLVGHRGDMQKEKYDIVDQRIKDFIDNEHRSVNNLKSEIMEHDGATLWVKDFKARNGIETVRNCTKLPKEFIDMVLERIINKLLAVVNICDLEDEPRKWNRGGKLTINDLAHAIPHEWRQNLKQECKGLQTLLKNHYYIFDVRQGYVQFRSPENLKHLSEEIKKKGQELLKWKQKDCWFYKNHPDKCPLQDNLCSYKHSG